MTLYTAISSLYVVSGLPPTSFSLIRSSCCASLTPGVVPHSRHMTSKLEFDFFSTLYPMSSNFALLLITQFFVLFLLLIFVIFLSMSFCINFNLSISFLLRASYLNIGRVLHFFRIFILVISFVLPKFIFFID